MIKFWSNVVRLILPAVAAPTTKSALLRSGSGVDVSLVWFSLSVLHKITRSPRKSCHYASGPTFSSVVLSGTHDRLGRNPEGATLGVAHLRRNDPSPTRRVAHISAESTPHMRKTSPKDCPLVAVQPGMLCIPSRAPSVRAKSLGPARRSVFIVQLAGEHAPSSQYHELSPRQASRTSQAFVLQSVVRTY